jgi:uncharacterized repeat protein (TIGR01451 family)
VSLRLAIRMVSGLVGLVVLALAAPAHAAFPGTNGKIAFEICGQNCEIYVMDPDGTLQTNITNNSASDTDPAWSAIGNKIAFVSTRDAVQEIYKMNEDGSGVTRLTNNSSADVHPAWSPDGNKIAFTSYRNGQAEIYVMNADGTGQTNVTNNPADDLHPAWSPDGSKIAFSSSRTGGAEIYKMNPDGSGVTRLTTYAMADSEPNWSPSGQKIAFAADVDYSEIFSNIFVMNADGSGRTNVVGGGTRFDQPAWSPDGQKIAFTQADNSWIQVVNADGSERTTVAAPGSNPDWQPITPTSEDLSLIKADSMDPVVAGKTLTYTLTVRNGPSTSTGVIVTDNLPTGVTFVSATPSQGSCSQAGATVTCNLGTLAGRQNATVVINVTPQTYGTIINSASVRANEVDPVPGNNADQEATAVRPFPTPKSADFVRIRLVPIFYQCGTPNRPANSTHGSPFSHPSCEPPQPGSEVARFGSQTDGRASLAANTFSGDIGVDAYLPDVKTLAGSPYNPNPAGPDLTMYVRLRITDTYNGASQTDPGTASDLSVSAPLDCDSVGTCFGATTINAVNPGAIKKGKYMNVQVFRVRIDDAGVNGIRGDSDDRIFAMQGLYIPGGSAPYTVPKSASPMDVPLVPVFKQCGSANSTHGAPLSVPSCTPPVSLGVAQVGPQSAATAQLTVTSDPITGFGSDVAITANATDIQTQGQADYNPNPSGPDVTLVQRIRITDQLNGSSQTNPGTVVDFDFPVPANCAPTSDTRVGSACSVNTAANAVVPGAIKQNKQMVLQVFRLRLVDSGPDGARGNSDDTLFAQQGLYIP